jgi:hypothetical protein
LLIRLLYCPASPDPATLHDFDRLPIVIGPRAGSHLAVPDGVELVLAERAGALVAVRPGRDDVRLEVGGTRQLTPDGAAIVAVTRQRLKDKAAAGDRDAGAQLAKVKRRLANLQGSRRQALLVLEREPELFDIGDVELLVHALVVPSSDPEDKRRQDAEVELIAMAVAQAHEEAAGARVIDVHTPDRARLAGLLDYPGFDLLSLRRDGEERDIEVKGRARVGAVELSENEWARAATLREKFWLYVVFDCATERPRLHVVQDPFSKLLLLSRTSVVVGVNEILRHSESREGVVMTRPIRPKGPVGSNDLERLLAQLDTWRAEPLEDEDGTVAEIDRALREHPLRLRDPDLSGWKEEDG